ncbi:MAG: sulfatase-like hydrolase/transferase [Planctomycetota bacterium]
MDKKATSSIFTLFLILMILFCKLGRCNDADVATERSPNFLIVLVDDLGYGDLSSYGAKDLLSPRIDELMASGLKFSRAYANCPVCSPTRASLFTGKYPERVGVPGVIRTHASNNWGYLAQDAILLPQYLKQSGYHNALVGKWHLGLRPENYPNRRGFDFFHGFLGDMMDDYYTHQRHGEDYMYCDGDLIYPKGHATDLFTQWSCEYLTERSRNPKQPFCLTVTYNAPHTPIQPPETWLQNVQARMPGLSQKRSRLVALIEHLDDGIGKIVDCLNQTGLAENTVIIFTSDNGGHLNAGASNGNLRDGKQSMYEGGIRVPACVVWPGKVPAGSETSEPILTMDILPTVCEIAGTPLINDQVDGISFLKLLKDPNSKLPSRDLFFHRREGGTRYGGMIANAVIRGPWKLLQNSPFSPQELYRLDQDPLEEVDLRNKHPKKFKELAAALRLQVQLGGEIPWQKKNARQELK